MRARRNHVVVPSTTRLEESGSSDVRVTGRIAGGFPGFDAALERLDVGEAVRLVLRCLTGSARLGGSGAVENDFLRLRQ
jgi:hypothetical protein